jgi:Flp pilus assembly pilin Flp
MPDQLRWLSIRIWQWLFEESGQDLMEYALLVVLASLVAITIQENIAAALATAFTKVSTTLA